MNSMPNFKLSRLREIGWSDWDPIGLKGLKDRPDDEYDAYLIKAAMHLWNGKSLSEVADYLVSVEANFMGIGVSSDSRSRADGTASAISAYLAELRS